MNLLAETIGEILTMKEVAVILKYKKNCSARNWCTLRGIPIRHDSGSNRHYVLQADFEKAWNENISRYRMDSKESKTNLTPENSVLLGKHGQEFLANLHNNLP